MPMKERPARNTSGARAWKRIWQAVLIAFPFFLVPQTGTSQCEFAGMVVDVTGTGSCSLAISGPGLPVLELNDNPYGLEPGDQILFSYDTLIGQPSCGLGLPVTLSCVFVVSGAGSGSTCDALFSWFLDDPYTHTFQPYIVPPLGLYYEWDFGDGQTATEISPVHTFAQDGVYEVCLTLTDAGNCINTYCDTLVVGFVPSYCDFSVEISINGLDLTAEVFNTTDFGPYHPQVVEWVNSATGEVLGDSAFLQVALPDSSYLQELCVYYEVEYPDGTICSDSWCGNVWENNSCVDATLIDTNVVCPNVFLPVCGCDGVTYYNECEALYYHGITSWTPGPCTGDYGQCVAYFSIDPQDDTHFLLTNTSVGDYDQFHWILDGGSPFEANVSPLLLDIPQQGYHTVCIEIWDTTTGCTSIYCQEIYSGDPDYQCYYTDCVWPGDANGNAVANVYDLLNIGLGYGALGLPRPYANMNWQGQPAPNWGLAVLQGVDYKHMDCNGDGKVIYDDVMAIGLNYGPGEVPAAAPTAGGLPVYFLFDTDTIYVDETTPEFIPVTGGLYIGTPDQPAVDLHGLGITLEYPQQDLLLPWSTTADYLDNSFFGVSNQSLWMSRDLHEEKRIDMGFTRKAGQGASGYGRIANANFIIISDIIGGRTDEYIPFELIIKGMEMIDENGAPVIYDLPILTDSLIIVNNFATSVEETGFGPEIRLYPNPTTGRVRAEWPDLVVESVQVYNALGQELRQLSPEQQEWSLEGLESGMYTLRFRTDKGVVNKKIVLER